jgi:hypothetical protein
VGGLLSLRGQSARRVSIDRFLMYDPRGGMSAMPTKTWPENHLDGPLRAAADELRASTSAAVEASVAEAERLVRWKEVALEPELRRLVDERLHALGAEVLAALVRWRGVGGAVAFPPASGEGPRSEPVVEPIRGRSPRATRGAAIRGTNAPTEVGRPVQTPPPPESRASDPVAPKPERAVARASSAKAPRQASGAAPQSSPPAPLAIPVEPARVEAQRIPEEPATPEPTPAAEVDMLALAREFGPNLRSEPSWQERLVRLLEGLGPEQAVGPVLDAALNPDRWKGLPAPVQRSVITYLVARLRTASSEIAPADLDGAFSSVTRFMQVEQPGFVHGLHRAHPPKRGSWPADAAFAWAGLLDKVPGLAEVMAEDAPSRRVEDALREVEAAGEPELRVAAIRAALEVVSERHPRLVRLAADLVDRLEQPEFRGLRRAIRAELADPAEEEGAAAEAELPVDWAGWAKTRGRRAVMIGGSPREPNRQRIERIFGFQSLEWRPAEHRRNGLQTLRNSIRSGGVDLLLVLRDFVGHDADDVLLPACREAGVDWAHVEHGYGTGSVRRAIERYVLKGE